MLYPNLSYKEAPPEMTDNIIFLRTCRVLFPIQVCGCVYVFGTAASWLIYYGYCGMHPFNWVLKGKQD